ncbi:MAG: glycogen debranching protein [Chitinophagaceae bacterium]|nr:glycogen debranching protein [Chitinophagaceae bacterium]
MKSISTSLVMLFLLAVSTALIAQQKNDVIWRTKPYTVYSDSVVQGEYTARALSPTEIISDYKSPANLLQSTKISFKFSLNGKDNEMMPGVDHHLNVQEGIATTPLIKFGEPLKDNTGETNTYLKPDTRLKISVDMNAVLNDFKAKGYFTTFKGDKIYKEDFKGLYVAGNTLPMDWDFDNLHNKQGLELKDEDGDGIYETNLMLNAQKDEKQTDASWKLSKNISGFPQYHSGSVLADAIYNMSVEEMIKAVEPDSTFRTGKEWAGVWTRDISYSIILAMAHLQPEVAKKSLMRKVSKKKRIIQDTGTGGAYPCSTDRMIWATAAFEIYKATGDRDWLQQAYIIIKNSVNDDMSNAYDAATGLVKGESSFLDWREQTYPKWMQPADIYESENLGTNAVHYNANMVLVQMANLLKKPAEAIKYRINAVKIKAGINNHLWMSDKGYYARYLYGRNFKTVSPGSEALGEALCVLFDIADKQKQQAVISSVPVTDFGISCIYPQIPNIPPYHNNAVWPFVQSYWALAAAKTGNENAVMESIAAIYRPAALFLTNKENFVADNGDFAGTVINSSNMLWSLSGNLAMVQKLIFGIEFQADKLVFHPFVPTALQGNRSLINFKYRNAVLNILMEGYGNKIQSFEFDGKPLGMYEVAGSLSGKHTIKIVLSNSFPSAEKINKVENVTTPATPAIAFIKDKLTWQPVEGAKNYSVLKRGKKVAETTETHFATFPGEPGEYQVIAVSKNGVSSFASEPLVVNDSKKMNRYELESGVQKSLLSYKGFSGNGFVEINTKENRRIDISITIDEPGLYAISFRYANGNGPVNTENKCAIRTLSIDQQFAGTVVFPQRGKEEWSNWGMSNALQATLSKGKHVISVSFKDANDNMNEAVNEAMLDYLEIVKIK